MSSDADTNGEVEVVLNRRALHSPDGSASPQLNHHVSPNRVPSLKRGSNLHLHPFSNSSSSRPEQPHKCNGDVSARQLSRTPSDSTPVDAECGAAFTYELSAGRSAAARSSCRKESAGGLSSSMPLSPILKNRNDSSCVRYDAGGGCEVLVNVNLEEDACGGGGSLQDESLDMDPGFPLRSPAEGDAGGALLDPLSASQYRNKHVRISSALTELEYVVEDEENALRIKYLRAKAPVVEGAEGDEAADRSVGSGRSSRSRSPGRGSGSRGDSDREEISPFRHTMSYKRRLVSKRFIKFFKSLVRFMFSHVGLLLLVAIYASGGALLFPLVEHEIEMKGRVLAHNRTDWFAGQLIKLAFNISMEMIHDENPFGGADARRSCAPGPDSRYPPSSPSGGGGGFGGGDAELDLLRPPELERGGGGEGVTGREPAERPGGADPTDNAHDESVDDDMFGSVQSHRQRRRRRALAERTGDAALQKSRLTPNTAALFDSDTPSHSDPKPTAFAGSSSFFSSSSAARRLQSVRRVRRRAPMNFDQWKWQLEAWQKRKKEAYHTEISKKLQNFQSHIFVLLVRTLLCSRRGWCQMVRTEERFVKQALPRLILYT